MGSALPGPIPDEPRATCGACPLCAPPEDPEAPGFFHPSTKCCASEPALPNFLVGRALLDADTRDTVLGRLVARGGVGPLGLETTRRGELLRRSAVPDAHGRAPEFRCPHFRDEGGGTCGIWRHRNALCATWFCRHTRGRVGHRFWRAVQRLLEEVERDLSRWCALALDPGGEARAALMESPPPGPILLDAHDLRGGADPGEHARRWGRWAGQEEAYYRACAAEIEALDWEGVLARTGPGVRLALRTAMEAWEALADPRLPDALTLGPLQIQGAGPGGVTVQTYLRTDPMRLSPELMAALPYFDGGRVDEALIRIEETLGVSLDPALLQHLSDFGVLDPA